MREVGLYALIFGVNKTVKKFGYDENSVKEWVLKAFDDPFVKVVRALVLETIQQVGKKEASRIFKISPVTLQRFIDENKISAMVPKQPEYLIDEWHLEKYD